MVERTNYLGRALPYGLLIHYANFTETLATLEEE